CQPVRVETAQHPLLQRTPADADPYFLAGGETLLRLQVLHELDALQQPLAADVADHPMFLRQPLEARSQPFAHCSGVAAQVALQNLAQHRNAGGTRDWIALERVALDEAGVLADRPPEGIGNRLLADHGRQRREAAAQSL